MRGLRLGALLIVLATFPAAASLPVALPDADPGLVVDGARLGGPRLVEAGVPNTYLGSFRTGAIVTTVALTDHEGETVGLDVDGVRIADTTVGRDQGFRFTVALPRGHHELRAVPSSATSVTLDPHFVTAAVRPGAPLALTTAPGTYWDDVRLSWQPPADDGDAAITEYRYAVTPEPRSAGFVAPESTSVDLRLFPGVDHSFTVLACNAIGCGPASAPVAYRLPQPVGVDDISLEVWEIIVCNEDHSFCGSVEPGASISVPGTTFEAIAQTRGRAVRGDEGAQIRFDLDGDMAQSTTVSPVVEVSTAAPGKLDAVPREQFLAFRGGEYSASAGLGFGDLSDLAPNQCRRLAILVTATFVGDTWTNQTTARICRSG